MTVGNLLPAHDEATPDRGESGLRLVFVLAAFGALAWYRWTYALFVVLLLVSITLHEFGHYLGAKRGGMKPTEFFIGFGPRIFSFRRGETEFGLKPILLGAYVKVPGMHNLEEVDPADEPRTYRAQSYRHRFGFVFAGPGMNLLIALVGFCIFFASFTEYRRVESGTPSMAPVAGGPSALAGVREGDELLSIDGQEFASVLAAIDYIHEHGGDTVVLTVRREGQALEVPVTVAATNPAGEPVGFLGVQFQADTVAIDRNVPQGIQAGFTEFGREIGATVVGIGRIFSPSGLANLFQMVTGQREDDPTQRATSLVGISKAGAAAVQSGFADTLVLLSALNLALGLFNLLPVLPFDGGHLLIATYERIRSRRGRKYQVDFARVMPYFLPIVMIVLFVVVGSLVLDARQG